MLQIVQGAPPYLFAICAAICFALTILFAFRKDGIKLSTLFGGLFFLCSVLAYFPQLDSVAAFSINVKLHNNLNRAEELISKLRELSVVNAETSYMTFTWGNRFGGPYAKDKQKILDGFNGVLTELNVNLDERQALADQYVRMIGFDLYGLYLSVIDNYLQWKGKQFDKGKPDFQEKIQKFNEGLAQWRALVRPVNLRIEDFKFDLFLEKAVPNDMLEEAEIVRSRDFAKAIAALYDGCRKKGGYTTEAALFVDTYGPASGDQEGIEHKVEEVFGVKIGK
jgi:hypothetical protein